MARMPAAFVQAAARLVRAVARSSPAAVRYCPHAVCLVLGFSQSACMIMEEFRTPPVGPLLQACAGLDTDPGRSVSFSRDLLPILRRDQRQAGCSCHQPTAVDRQGIEESELDLSNFATLMRGGTRSVNDIVIPNAPCDSILYLKLIAPPFGDQMPFSGPPFLSKRETDLFHDWIAEGARDN